MTIEGLLRDHPLLALLASGQMAKWIAAGSEAAYEKGETILQQNTPGAWAYLVLEGRVRVVRTGSSGMEVPLGLIGPGEIFGEYALVPPGLNTATCRTAARSRLLQLPLAPLAQSFEGRPEVAGNLKNWLRLYALIQHLRSKTFLGFLSGPSALKHLPHLESVTAEPQCAIQTDGLSDDRWHFIERGRAWAPETSMSPARELGPGDWFGERALLGLGMVPTVVAQTKIECQALSRAAFMGLELSDPNICQGQTFQPPSDPTQTREWVGQQQAADCGLASLAMIARHHGLALGVEQLRRRLCPGESGISLVELQTLAEGIGLPCTAVRIGARQWNRVRLPALVHMSEGHYIVLFRFEVGGVQVGDPAAGILNRSMSGFLEKCSGRALVFAPPTVQSTIP